MRIIAFLKCASCRFAALYFVPFAGGLVWTGRGTLGYIALGALFWIVHSLGIEVTNRLSDRNEDEINRPERTRLCECVGWHELRLVQLFLWCAVLAIDVAWLVLAGNLLFGLLLALSFCIGVAYSRGPRLARTRYIGLLTFNLVFCGIFIMGWSVGNPFSRSSSVWLNQLASFGPLLVIVGLFIVTLIGVKDLTDRAGDLHIGYQSLFVDLLERRRTTVMRCMVACPFVLILASVSLGMLPARLAALIGFAPISAIVVEAIPHAQTRTDRLLVREVFYHYWLVFSSASLLLLLPGKALALAVAGASCYWVITSRWLHWSERLRISDTPVT
jgi:4-hydroxybenzoate polyprenyltransferase